LKNIKNLTKESIFIILEERFKNFKYKKLSQAPQPNLFKDMKKSTDRIVKAIQNNEQIVIIGDYDVDGVVSTAILKDFFNYINFDVEYIIPNRFTDGYGITPNIINRIINKIDKCNLIITVDNGIASCESANLCIEKGIDLIITDHHTVPSEIPKAYSIINPKQKDCNFPFQEICGAQISWYLVASLKKALNINLDMKIFFDILIIAIIADIMPIISLNYVMVKIGLKSFNLSNRFSILAIKESLNSKSLTSEDIAFMVAPKINSAGRMESASIAVEFLLSKTMEEARIRLEYLNKLNQDRKVIESEIIQYAENEVDNNDSVIVVAGENWNEGVIGIVASRLVDKFLKPAVVISISNNIGKASCRSLGEIDIYNILIKQKDLYLKFGGHKLAAGLSLQSSDIQKFKKLINQDKFLIEQDDIFYQNVLGRIKFNQIDFELSNIISKFEPYGFKNQKPIFLSQNIYIIDIRKMGDQKQHIKLKLKELETDIILDAIMFNCSKDILIGQKIDIIFGVSINNFRGQKNLQLMLKEFRNS